MSTTQTTTTTTTTAGREIFALTFVIHDSKNGNRKQDYLHPYRVSCKRQYTYCTVCAVEIVPTLIIRTKSVSTHVIDQSPRVRVLINIWRRVVTVTVSKVCQASATTTVGTPPYRPYEIKCFPRSLSSLRSLFVIRIPVDPQQQSSRAACVHLGSSDSFIPFSFETLNRSIIHSFCQHGCRKES